MKSPLEEAIEELGRHSWSGINIIGDHPDWVTSSLNNQEHRNDCPYWKLYRDLVMAAARVKSEWLKTSNETKDMLFSASLKCKEIESGRFENKKAEI